MNSTDLARLHVETAVKLTSISHVQSLLDSYGSIGAGAGAVSVTPAPKSTRGRKPGAAATEARCHWNIGTDAQCKNNKKGENSYCGMHIGKIHLIDEGSAVPSVF